MSDSGSAASTKTRSRQAKHKSPIREFISTILIALVIALSFRTFAYEPFNIPSGSMYPNLLVGDYLLVSKFSYGYSRHSFPLSLGPFSGRIFESPVERGDVAVFKWPEDNSTDYIKRIIGLPGDTIETIKGVLHINGEPVKREQLDDFVHPDSGLSYHLYRDTLPNGVSYLNLSCRYERVGSTRNVRRLCSDRSVDNAGPFVVPADRYFAMGDNRQNSSDSRDPNGGVGMIPAENLVGRADVIFFSTCGGACDAPLWKPWNWFGSIRYDRIFDEIR